MQTFDQHILEIYDKKLICGTEALRWTSSPGALAMAMRGIKRIGK
jgi:Tfp pilus assembly ATPase PilU